MQQQENQSFTLVDWQVQPAINRLAIDEHIFELEPKVMQVLLCLYRHDGELVTKDTLLDEVWQGVSISDDAIYCSISKIRKAFRQVDENRSPQLKTINRRGYMLSTPPPYPIINGESQSNQSEGATTDSVALHERRHNYKHGRRQKDQVVHHNQKNTQQLSAAIVSGYNGAQAKEQTLNPKAGKERKRVAISSELKVLSLEVFVGEKKSDQQNNNEKKRIIRQEILLLMLLIVVLAQAVFMLFLE